ncbi:MAG: bifunctional homocysteine S-methyltransferase/methylenetetrahydrofolate reductase [Planctomycetes bacterium]|nr:bifunctional homocysteine S-methyltransferase/methylenetetrahydrofolate reductase [Planctomycetota bacterium]
MAKDRLSRLLGPDGIAVCDGAMGTMLYAKGVFINRSFDELNLSQPDLVRSVHEAYVAAGADVIETNTFSANRFRLAAYGLEGLVAQINTEAVRLARLATEGTQALVAGSMGPLGVRIEPWGPTSIDEARAAFAEQASALIEAGVDLIMLETFSNLPELREAVEAIRTLSDEIPVVASVTVTEEGATPEGVEPASFARTIDGWDVDAIGVNCSVGPVTTFEAIEDMRRSTSKPMCAMPNAGAPREVGGRLIYLSSPEFLASYAKRFVKAGVRLVGGCCGTGPEHIRAIKDAVIAVRPEATRPALTADEVAKRALPVVPLAEKSRLGKALAEGSFPIVVQVAAARGCAPDATLDFARGLREAGVDLLAISEGTQHARMPPLATAQLLAREVGVECVIEYACRERTLMRMQSELLGAHALGIRDLLLVTGSSAHPGDPRQEVSPEVDSIGLANMVHRLNQGLDVGGSSLDGRTRFVAGVHFHPYAMDLDHELRRIAWKVDAGAEFALTPPIYNLEGFERAYERLADHGLAVIATVTPLSSYREAEHMRRLSGPDGVPDAVLERLRDAERSGSVRKVGEEITHQIVDALRGKVAGLQILSSRTLEPTIDLVRYARGG